MIEAILKQLKIKFNMLKELIFNNSFDLNQAKAEIEKFIFTLNILETSVKQMEDELAGEKFEKIIAFKNNVLDFKTTLNEIYSTESNDEIVKEFQEKLPEAIRSDSTVGSKKENEEENTHINEI